MNENNNQAKLSLTNATVANATATNASAASTAANIRNKPIIVEPILDRINQSLREEQELNQNNILLKNNGAYVSHRNSTNNSDNNNNINTNAINNHHIINSTASDNVFTFDEESEQQKASSYLINKSFAHHPMPRLSQLHEEISLGDALLRVNNRRLTLNDGTSQQRAQHSSLMVDNEYEGENISMLRQYGFDPADPSNNEEFSEPKPTYGYFKSYFVSMLQPSDNKLAMKLFGSKKGVLKEKLRQQEVGHWIIHPCSNFR